MLANLTWTQSAYRYTGPRWAQPDSAAATTVLYSTRLSTWWAQSG